MRDILFRGQTRRKGEYIVNMAGDKCESHWVYGGIFPQNKDGDFAIIYQQEPEIRKFTVYADTVGQYTGLTDKNGVRIFEGDIVERVSDGEQAVISWLKYSACFGLSFDGWCCGFDNYDDNLPSDFKVIGNIHDNPDILKGGGDNG